MLCPMNTGRRTKSEGPGDGDIRFPHYPVGRSHNPPKAANSKPSQNRDWQKLYLYQKIFRSMNERIHLEFF